jgi:RNA polymerase sigma-70 factor (ECF subfamily)
LNKDLDQPTTWNRLFTELTENSWDTLYRFSLSLHGNAPEAEDLVQQTLLKALVKFPAFFLTHYDTEDPTAASLVVQAAENDVPIKQHIQNWLMKIAKNTFLDSVGHSSRKRSHVSLEDWQENDAPSQLRLSQDDKNSDASGSNLADMEKEFFRLALDDDWLKKFEGLNPRQRSVIFLVAEEYSYKEIAQLLDIPMGTVMSTLSRALAKLKKSAD